MQVRDSDASRWCDFRLSAGLSTPCPEKRVYNLLSVTSVYRLTYISVIFAEIVLVLSLHFPETYEIYCQNLRITSSVFLWKKRLVIECWRLALKKLMDVMYAVDALAVGGVIMQQPLIGIASSALVSMRQGCDARRIQSFDSNIALLPFISQAVT